MKIISLTIAIILSFAFLLLNAQTKVSTDRIAVTAKRMIDIRPGKEIRDVVILIEKNKIAAVGSNRKISDSLQIIALDDATILPGLIDAHTHLLHQYYTRYGDDNSNSAAEIIYMGQVYDGILSASAKSVDQ